MGPVLCPEEPTVCGITPSGPRRCPEGTPSVPVPPSLCPQPLDCLPVTLPFPESRTWLQPNSSISPFLPTEVQVWQPSFLSFLLSKRAGFLPRLLTVPVSHSLISLANSCSATHPGVFSRAYFLIICSMIRMRISQIFKFWFLFA